MTTLGLSDRAWELYEAAGKENSHASDLSQIEGYDSSRTKGYENLGKLAFAQNSESLVKEGNTLTDEALLQKEIKQIYPVDQQGEYVAGVVLGEEKNLTKILVEFTDGSRKEISLTYVDTIDNLVAVYYSKDLGITYHYDKYVSTIDTSFKEELLNIVKAYTYDGNLDS